MDTLSWVPGGEKWAAPPVKSAQILTYAPFLRSKNVTFARNSLEKYAEDARNSDIGTIDTPGTMYMSIKMGENRGRGPIYLCPIYIIINKREIKE